MTHIARALISTANKTGIIPLAKQLQDLNIELLATGNTAKLLNQHNIDVSDISAYIDHPEILNGRVKTLHPKVHGGILARRSQDEVELKQHDIKPIDLVIVNLYPFAQTIAQADGTIEQAIEQIDIGGPTLLRSAAKNARDVTAVIDPQDYALIIKEIQTHGNTTANTRQRLAVKVFTQLAEYNGIIARYLQTHLDNAPDLNFPLTYGTPKSLRYGENPQQAAQLLPTTQATCLATTTPLQGKALSYNNLIDADAAWECVREWPANTPACVIVKHTTPCGVAIGHTLASAYLSALSTDPVSAFGGIVASNQTIDSATATAMLDQFIEVIIAPAIDADAQAILSRKKNCRILICPLNSAPGIQLKSIDGGILMQDPMPLVGDQMDYHCATTLQPTLNQIADLTFAWKVVKHVKSNAIVYAKDGRTLGIGSGQTSRVFSARIAALKAEDANLNVKDAVMASGAFFPFADSIELAAQIGIKAIIQPGGSKRDPEVIAAADNADIAMLFTGYRQFKH